MKTKKVLNRTFSLVSNCRQTMQAAALLAVALTASQGLVAAPMVGGFNITGSVRVDLTSIDWGPTGGGTGSFQTVDPSTGDFSGMFSNIAPFNMGMAKDLIAPPVPVARFLDLFTAPLLVDFYFDLSSVLLPVAPACTAANPPVDQACSLGTFTLRNTNGGGVAVDFGILGFFQNGLDASTRTMGRGLYTTQLVGESVASIFNTINTGGSIAASYSANFTTLAAAEIPEPATSLLVGLGLTIAGFMRRRR